MKIKRVVFVLLIAAQLASTGCWCMNRNNNKWGNCFSHGSTPQSGCFTAPSTGCNECSGYGPQMFGTPVMNNAMLQSPGAPVDERLGTPAKQTPYEGPAKKQ
ncbi:MAG: hypothetical protein QM703_12180 [Gemmatales bacterium]